MPNNEYWSIAGDNWRDDLDEVARIKMWAVLFREHAGLQEEEAEDLADSIVSHVGDSEIDTKAMDTVLSHLWHNKRPENINISTAINTFLSVMSDTFYTCHAMAVPKLGIKPKERPFFNSMLKQYLTLAWHLGALSSKQNRSTDTSE
jgi:hypothetical protein